MAALFDHAPAGAEVVWAVPTLEGFSDRIAAFAAETGLDRHAPHLGDALDAIKDELGVNQGVDDDGSLMVVVSGLAAAIDASLDDNPDNDDLKPTALLLVPVRDYAAFVTAMGGNPDDDATPVTLNGSRGFARAVPGYAVIADSAEAVAAYAPGAGGNAVTEAVGDQVGPWFEQGQSLVYVDVAAMAPSLKSAIALGMEEMNREMEEGKTASMVMLVPLMTAYSGMLDELIDGTDTLALTLDLDNDGLGLTMGGRLNEGSEMAKMLRPAAADGEKGSLLTRMPDQPHLFAAAADLTRIDTTALSDAVRRVATQVKAAADDDQAADGAPDPFAGLPIDKMVDLYLEMMQVAPDATAMGSVMYAPDPAAMMSGGFFKQLNVTQTADAEGALERQEKVMAKMNDLVIPLPGFGGGGHAGHQHDGHAHDDEEPGVDIRFETTYTEDAIEINGTQVDQFQVKTVLPPEMMQQFGPAAMVMGNTNSGGYLAAKDGHVLATTVTDPQLVTQGLKALEAEDGLGADAQMTGAAQDRTARRRVDGGVAQRPRYREHGQSVSHDVRSGRRATERARRSPAGGHGRRG